MVICEFDQYISSGGDQPRAERAGSFLAQADTHDIIVADGVAYRVIGVHHDSCVGHRLSLCQADGTATTALKVAGDGLALTEGGPVDEVSLVPVEDCPDCGQEPEYRAADDGAGDLYCPDCDYTRVNL